MTVGAPMVFISDSYDRAFPSQRRKFEEERMSAYTGQWKICLLMGITGMSPTMELSLIASDTHRLEV